MVLAAPIGLPNGARCFDIDDNRCLQINEIIVGIGKERMPLERSCPLRRWIGARDKLRPDFAGRAPCSVVERVEIFLHRTARRGERWRLPSREQNVAWRRPQSGWRPPRSPRRRPDLL